MPEETCKTCGMPLKEAGDKCSCEPSVCYHCCTCNEDCECGCKKKDKKE